ncbi:hypothetical protein ABIB62_004725 [Mucilaginibacter sp. UYP25]
MFTFLLTISGICIFTYLLKTILGISFNFVYMLNDRPYIWLSITFITGFLSVLLFWLFNWSITVLQWSFLLSFIWFLTKRPKGVTGREMYLSMGIKSGNAFHLGGMFLFLVSSIVTFIALYAEVIPAGH